MTRTLLVEGKKTLRITIPDDARVTYGPFSPPSGEAKFSGEKALVGTLRIYKGGTTKATESILAVFTDVRGFRDLSAVEYEEQIATEEVRTVWKSDVNGYSSEVNGKIDKAWVPDPALRLASGEEGGDF